MNIVTREMREQNEHAVLSPEASFADQSQGRPRAEAPDMLRTCYQCDRDRIIHSKSFRRLAKKTQVFLAPEGDHYRTRLTHTLEVAQVSCAISRSLGLNSDLTEAIALGHDLGHTPFGHAGERALRRALAQYRGVDINDPEAQRLFRHNEQSVRIVEKLENNGRGLNLSVEVTDGIRCHTDGLRAMTYEGRIVSIADRIAYVCHDIDDAERAGLVVEDQLPEEPRRVLGGNSSQRIETMVQDVAMTSAKQGDIAMSREVWDSLMALRAYLYANLYRQGDAKSEEPKAERLTAELFFYFIEHFDEVPAEYRQLDDPQDMLVADYVASMTDRYAIKVYEDLNIPKAWGMRQGAR